MRVWWVGGGIACGGSGAHPELDAGAGAASGSLATAVSPERVGEGVRALVVVTST